MTTTKLKLNLGPQHPSTHGVLRLILELEGEKILSCEPDVGYLHRGMEKMAEKLNYIQYLPTVDRIDYLAGFFYSQLLCDIVEKAMKVELSDKVRAIRVMLLELNRISSHLLWVGMFMMDLGAVSPFFYTFREREMILRYFERLTGQRMMYNYFTFGGVHRNQVSLYKGFDIRTIVMQEKDSWSRYKARILEIKESMNIVHQALEYLKKSEKLEQRLINPLNLKLPQGEYFSQIEAPRGLASCYVCSDGSDKPYRLKWRTGSYYSVNLLRELLVGEYLNDAIAIAGSLDIILPEVDK